MPTIKSLFLTGGSRFIFNSCTQKTAMFDKTDYDNYCKSYITNMDSNEGLRANLYLFSKYSGGVSVFRQADRGHVLRSFRRGSA
jgi:hypothetical protein